MTIGRTMLLAIDIGNSHTVIGLFDRKTLSREWRIETVRDHTAVELAERVLPLLRQQSIDPTRVDTIGVSNVVPALNHSYHQMATSAFGIPPIIIDGSLDLGFRILYKDPMAVGADRLCNAAAGFTKHAGPLIIVDYGTATTYDIVALNGDYVGGVIAPGVETSAADLHRRAARLPRIELQLPATLIGRDTTSSMQAGILYGAIDATERMVDRLKKEIQRTEGTLPKVIGTGGFSAFIAEHSKVLEHVEPHLVLDGIRIICERVRPS